MFPVYVQFEDFLRVRIRRCKSIRLAILVYSGSFNNSINMVTIKEYGALFRIWSWPVAASEVNIPLDQVDSFRYEFYENWELGTTHEMIGLYLITAHDTVMIGRRMVNHGEFGWLNFSGNDHQKAEKEGKAAIEYLNGLTAK